ncbi:hypothetical protein DY000_02052943 [Brassica cretica]|uniref:Uncharacterized protein n=1 Tax=Brassica cretica TaxID=69181 RepID=A0ABQ7AGS6_BRACR|nr:hypothetical protein DY000_02052943 [Brassica cretica]
MENSDADRQLELVSDPVIVGALGENLETGAIEQPPTKTKGNKRAAPDSPVSRKDAVLEPSVASAREGSTEAAAGAQPDEPPKKKKKSKKKKSAEKQVELSEGAAAQEIVVHDSYVGDARARAGEESSDPRVLPLEKKKRKKRSVAQPGPTLSVHDDRDRLNDPPSLVELVASPTGSDLITSKGAPDISPQLGDKVSTSPGGTQVGEGVLEISDSSSKDQSEKDSVEKTTGPELADAEENLGESSEPVETEEITPADEQTEGINIDPLGPSADVPDGSVAPVVNASEDELLMLLLFLLDFYLSVP